MGRKPNARGGRGAREFVARGAPRGRGGGRGDRGGRGAGRGDRGGRGGQETPRPAQKQAPSLLVSAENQRLILELLGRLKIEEEDEMRDQDSQSDDEGCGGEDDIEFEAGGDGEDDGDDYDADLEAPGAESTAAKGEILLAQLIHEERQDYVAQSVGSAASSSRAERLAAEKEAAKRGARAKGGKVRIIIAAWHHPETTQKRIVMQRGPTLSTLFQAARETLFIKRPKAAYLLATGSYIKDTMSLEEETVVVVTTKLPEVPKVAMGGGGGPRAPTQAAAPVSSDVVKEAYRRRAESRRRQDACMSDKDRANHSRMLKQAMTTLRGQRDYNEMLRVREALPVYGMREQITRLIDASQVVVLSGETGSGKTTQVPQFLLDSAIDAGRGAWVNILCTQPRRISAVGVADRVASERCEEVGGMVGYQIRLESKTSGRTRLTFLTTGILLRRLQEDPELEGVSHLLIDEVHERDLHTDFLLIIIKALLRRRRDLKVVLMSATLQASLFSQYFDGCPAIHVPGRTFAVRHHFLEEIQAALSSGPRGAGGKQQPKAKGGRGQGGGGGRGGGGRDGGGRDGGRGGGGRGSSSQGRGQQGSSSSSQPPGGVGVGVMSPKAEQPIDLELVISTLVHLLTMPVDEDEEASSGAVKGGAVLVFLPGFMEIDKTMQLMAQHPLLRDPKKVQAFPLHSSLPPDAQRSVFKKMQPGVRKVVVSTNIAETSITIDDVTHVIDAGRVKETRYDAATHMSSLVEVWVSKASAAQRAGRAGRVREGHCWRLYSKEFYDNDMPSHTLPEMLRTPLEELSLTILSLELGDPLEFLAQAIQPPASEAVTTAVRNLLEIEAIRKDKDVDAAEAAKGKAWRFVLTPLGFHLAYLPVDVRIGKMLIVGSILGCLEPILTVSACLSYKSPFSKPFGKQDEADRAHQAFASLGSDHIAALEAYNGYAQLKREPYRVRKEFCMDNFLSIQTLEMIDDLRRQFRQQLVEIGFASRGPPPPPEEVYKVDVALLQCVLTCGLYPQVGKLVRPQKAGEVPCFETKDKAKFFVHPGSVNFSRLTNVKPTGRELYILYHKKVSTTKVYVYDSTFVSPLAMLLFGGTLRIEREHSISLDRTVVTLDKWLSFRMSEQSAVLLKQLHKEVDKVLVDKISDPSIDVLSRSRPIADTITALLRTDTAAAITV